MISKPRESLNYLPLKTHSFGYERRVEMSEMPLEGSAFIPKPVVYADIDCAFREFAESIEIVDENGEVFPTFVLFSNQKFSEYAQTWKHTDKNNNLLLNFKAITRESNPQYGQIHHKMWNIPGERFYLVKKGRVLDDNGSESILSVMCRQPMAIDLMYKLSIFTDKYDLLNDFNIRVNRLFSARQYYIAPNGYYMPMKLENISDESEYSIDDRQYYSQTYSITVNAFILSEDDFRVEEWPIKVGASFLGMNVSKRRADVEIEECEIEEDEKGDLVLTLTFPKCVNSTEFVMDSNMKITTYDFDNLTRGLKIGVGKEEYEYPDVPLLKEDDVVTISVRHRNPMKEAVLRIYGTDPYKK